MIDQIDEIIGTDANNEEEQKDESKAEPQSTDESSAEEQKQDESTTGEDDGKKDETPLIKQLRKTIKAQDKELKTLKQKGATENTNLDSSLKEKVEMIVLKDTLQSKAPELADKVEELYKIQKKFPEMSTEEVIGHYLGKTILSEANKGRTPNLPNHPISIPTNKVPLEKMTLDQLQAEAEQEAVRLGWKDK